MLFTQVPLIVLSILCINSYRKLAMKWHPDKNPDSPVSVCNYVCYVYGCTTVAMINKSHLHCYVVTNVYLSPCLTVSSSRQQLNSSPLERHMMSYATPASGPSTTSMVMRA